MDRTRASRLSRLHRDLTELLETPYPGVSVFLDDADIRHFCLVLTPPSGPWKDLALHFDVTLPEDWPTHPPEIRTFAGIQHPNLYGTYICCDLLKRQEELEPGYTGGYSPALTLRGLFLQFLTFFSNSKEHGGVIDIGEACEIFYERECNLRLATTGCCRDHQHQYQTIPSYQNQLEQHWQADENPVITLHSYSSNTGQTIHQVKGKGANARRIHRFERPNPAREETYRLISTFRCTSCPYGSEELPHHNSFPLLSGHSATIVPPPRQVNLNCSLDTLNEDVLGEIASHLTLESLVNFGKAYSRMHDIMDSTHMLLRRELVCFCLRTPIQDSKLGVGITVDRRSRTLSSDFDWLSYEAFYDHGVCRSIQNRVFEFFLPLALNHDHFARASKHIWSSLDQIHRIIREAERTSINRQNTPKVRDLESRRPYEVVCVLYKMMNNVVTSLMKSCDDVLQTRRRDPAKGTLLYASEKAVISYCHLLHLITCLCRTSPAILRDAVNRLERFRDDPSSRLKQIVPDIGEFIILVILVGVFPSKEHGRVDWSSINGPVLEEVIIRNVRWVLQKSPELEKIETDVDRKRLKITFENSKTSLRLMMFQITFLNVFTRVYGGAGISRLDDNYGFAAAGIAEELVGEIKAIYQVDCWPEFFEKVEWARGKVLTEAKICDMLRGAVKASAARGYHTTGAFNAKIGRWK